MITDSSLNISGGNVRARARVARADVLPEHCAGHTAGWLCPDFSRLYGSYCCSDRTPAGAQHCRSAGIQTAAPQAKFCWKPSTSSLLIYSGLNQMLELNCLNQGQNYISLTKSVS